MRIAVLGTGPVGQTVALASRLDELAHEATLGTRDVEATMARTEPDTFGRPPFTEWPADHPGIAVAPVADTAAAAELVGNATNGAGSRTGEAACDEYLAGKVLVDIGNPLDFSQGMPPSLFVSNTDSLGEQIQRTASPARGW